MRNLGVTHRAIRPTNLYWMTAERDRMVLGDCVTVPPGLEQPVVYEPVGSGMCQPAGRGAGNYVDDSYSFGASLVALLRGRPLRQADDEVIIRQKILQGSYQVLVGEDRVPVQVIEVLRGLLCDDPEDRWSIESLDLWLAGRRLTPLLTKTEKRAARGFALGGKEYASARELAIAMNRNFETAAQAIIDGRLELWLRRSLDQNEKASAISNIMHFAVAAAAEKRPAFDMMVARVCMVLDNQAPIRYKGLAAMPDGLGSLLAVTLVAGGDIKIIVEAMVREAAKAWFETRDTYSPDNSMMEGNFREQKAFLERVSIGNGVERVLYELNDSMPCISPYVVNDYVIDIRDLLPALNAAAAKADNKGWPIDRHIAAFIAARAQFDVERQLIDLADPRAERSSLGMLNMLALLQWRLGQGGLYSLGGWIGAMLGPAVNSYHNREHRRVLEKEIPRIIREGSLIDLARLIDNPEERMKDQQGFAQARYDWIDANREVQSIEGGDIDANAETVRTARQLAALVSVTISLVTVSLLAISRFF